MKDKLIFQRSSILSRSCEHQNGSRVVGLEYFFKPEDPTLQSDLPAGYRNSLSIIAFNEAGRFILPTIRGIWKWDFVNALAYRLNFESVIVTSGSEYGWRENSESKKCGSPLYPDNLPATISNYPVRVPLQTVMFWPPDS